MFPYTEDAPLEVGDPAPQFEAHTLAGATINLSVVAGRWVVLCFLNELADAFSISALAELFGEAKTFDDDRMIFYGVFTKPPISARDLAQVSHPALGFLMDYTGEISREYGALGSSRVVILDPMQRVYADFAIGPGRPPVSKISEFMRSLPAVDAYAGVELAVPALVIPRVFEKEFCEFLVRLYEDDGGIESGFMVDNDGRTQTIVNHAMKSRRDLVIEEPEIRDIIRRRVIKRLVPAIERFFQYKPTRMDRYMVSCYSAETGGHFSRHRDNMNAGARHRRFAVSMNLNDDFDGCELMFPEFGRKRYRAPYGGAIVFSTGALHQVTQITRGKRYAFVPFLYNDEDARQRLANNAYLQSGEGQYTGENDRLYPDSAEKLAGTFIR